MEGVELDIREEALLEIAKKLGQGEFSIWDILTDLRWVIRHYNFIAKRKANGHPEYD